MWQKDPGARCAISSATEAVGRAISIDVAERRQRKRECNIQTFSSAGSDRVMEQDERDTYGDDRAHDEWQAGLEDGVVGAPEADMELRISVFLHVLHPRKYRRWQGAPMVCIRGPQQV